MQNFMKLRFCREKFNSVVALARASETHGQHYIEVVLASASSLKYGRGPCSHSAI